MTSANVLVVEDDALLAWALSAQLEDLGYRVIGRAATAEQAVAAVRRLAPDIVLMDIRLAGSGTGLDAARRIRALGDVKLADVKLADVKVSEVPILFCSCYADLPAIAEAVQAIGNARLTGKPVTGAELHRRLGDLLADGDAGGRAASRREARAMTPPSS